MNTYLIFVCAAFLLVAVSQVSTKPIVDHDINEWESEEERIPTTTGFFDFLEHEGKDSLEHELFGDNAEKVELESLEDETPISTVLPLLSSGIPESINYDDRKKRSMEDEIWAAFTDEDSSEHKNKETSTSINDAEKVESESIKDETTTSTEFTLLEAVKELHEEDEDIASEELHDEHKDEDAIASINKAEKKVESESTKDKTTTSTKFTTSSKDRKKRHLEDEDFASEDAELHSEHEDEHTTASSAEILDLSFEEVDDETTGTNQDILHKKKRSVRHPHLKVH